MADYKDKLRDDIALWFADGVIDQSTLDTLRKRYEATRFGLIGVIKYIGITGGLMAFFGIIGMITAMTESEVFAAVVLAGVGIWLSRWGLSLANDIRNYYATSSKVVLTLGVSLWTGAVGMIADSAGVKDEHIPLVLGFVCLPIAMWLAYKGKNTYLLIISLLAFFHWVGAWNAMWGRSTYVFAVQDPSIMYLVAMAVIGVGLYHERVLYPVTGRFYLAWESLGLVYFNMSLLILSIWSMHEGQGIAWVVIFSVATIVQIAGGAALQNGLIRVFGIVFFVINVFTRYHELFWDQYSLGMYLLIGGGLLVLIGVITEVMVSVLLKKRGPS